MEYSIREMTSADYDDVVALWKNTPGIGLSGADSRENIARFLARNPGLNFVAHDASGKMVGTILGGCDGRRGYLHHVAVDQACRHFGIARHLVEATLTALKQQGIEKCHIFVFRDNTNAVEFWRHVGWKDRTEELAMMSYTV